MRKRLQILVAVTSCALAIGAQWNVLQVVAWGRMLAGNARTMRFTAAVQKTFSGEMCGLCRVVAQATQQEDQAPPKESATGKVDLFWQAAAPCLCWRLAVDWEWNTVACRPFGPPRAEPLIPPPRWC